MKVFFLYISIIFSVPFSMHAFSVASDWGSMEEEVEMLEEIIEEYIALLFSDQDFRDKDPETKLPHQVAYGTLAVYSEYLIPQAQQYFAFQNVISRFDRFYKLANAP